MARDTFRELSREAVADGRLRQALINATDRFRGQRSGSITDFVDWDAMRDAAREIKRVTIENLDHFLVELEGSVTRAGGHVHWAADSDEATGIIKRIAREAGVRSVVKSKSMATEEIELNDALEEDGVRVVETDLGEYIIQLAGEKPSHIIAPAIHKTKEDVSALFTDKFGIPRYDDPEELTAFARSKLREEFINADMGVSGVNFAVAGTGTIAIVENEGNARLTTTLPRVHVALMGIEKVIPLYEHLPLFLTLLIRSATGQKLSTYISFITGPGAPDASGGPEELHLVLLDNGRSDILADEHTRESLYCVRCGACLNICPVYRQVGGHAYGGVYSGPIGSIISPQLTGVSHAHDIPFASSLCGACRDVCPVRIDIPRVLLELRAGSVEGTGGDRGRVRNDGGRAERMVVRLWRTTMQHEGLYGMAHRSAYYGQKVLNYLSNNTGLGRALLPAGLRAWSQKREIPRVAEETFRDYWKRESGD